MTSTNSIDGAIPKDGFIYDYIEWARSCVMAPDEFHLAAVLSALSAVFGNKVMFPLGGDNYPPNLWLVLMAASGGKKSSALQAAFRLLDQASGKRLRLATDMTREALWVTLRDRPAGYIQMSEFMSFLEASRRDYMSGITSDLCNFFDCPEQETRTTVSGGDVVVKRPAITIAAAAVAEAVSSWVRSRDLVGGFFSRFLYVVQESSPAYRGMVEWNTPARALLVSDLGGIIVTLKNHLNGLVTSEDRTAIVAPSPEAREMWEQFDRESQEDPDARVPEFSGLFSRAGMYAMKVAMCYALAADRPYPEEGGPGVEPQSEDMEYAIHFVDWCRRRMIRLVEEVLTVQSRDGADMERIRRAVMRLDHERRGNDGWVAYSDVLRRTHLTSRRMADLLDTMKETEALEFMVDPSADRRGRKMIRLKEEE